MNKIDKLIQEFCPDGVVFRHIWEVTAWDKKFNAVDNHKQSKTHKYTYLLASDLRKLAIEGGDVKLLSTGGELYGFTTETIAGNSISEGEIISIPWGGKATVQYYNGKFVTADNRIATSLDKEYLDNKYLYYFMLSSLRQIQSFYRGSGIQHPSMAKVLDMKVPVPPLEVQKEIVNILDKFTQLEAELSAELGARRIQYEHYRNQLFLLGKVTDMIPLNDICEYISSGKNKNKNTYGKYPVYGSTGVIGFADTYKYTGEVLLAARVGANAGFIQRVNGEYDVSDNTLMIKPRSGVKIDFLYHQLVNMNLNQYAAGGGQPLITGGKLKELMVVAPSTEEQIRIVNILNKFDKLVNDISEGLPAEIAARRKQYEYYRTKLLTFKELK